MLHFSSYNGDRDPNIMRETRDRVLDQALTRGEVAEACSILKRFGSKLHPGDGIILPLDIICTHLDKVALECTTSGKELVGDEDIATCKSITICLQKCTIVSALARRIGTSATGASIMFGGLVTLGQTPTISKGVKDKFKCSNQVYDNNL